MKSQCLPTLLPPSCSNTELPTETLDVSLHKNESQSFFPSFHSCKQCVCSCLVSDTEIKSIRCIFPAADDDSWRLSNSKSKVVYHKMKGEQTGEQASRLGWVLLLRLSIRPTSKDININYEICWQPLYEGDTWTHNRAWLKWRGPIKVDNLCSLSQVSHRFLSLLLLSPVCLLLTAGLIYATLWQLLLSLMRRRREDQSNGGVSLINKSIVSVSDAQTEICSLPGATAGKIHVETQESLDWATRNLQEVFQFFTWSTFCWLHLCVSTFTFTQASAVKALVMQVGPFQSVLSSIWSRLKYLNNYWLDCH